MVAADPQAARSLYAAFDRFPSAKGSATHIDAFARTLFEHHGPGLLYVLGDPRLPAAQLERDGTRIIRFDAPAIENALERGLAYAAGLERLLDGPLGERLELVHVRDPWGGVPALATERRAARGYRVVYELNGLPSIELPEHRPRMAPQTVAKLDRAERFCLTRADHVVTPSEGLARLARERGATRVTVVPNGADPFAAPSADAAPPDLPAPRYILYFGALQPWQGVETLLRAMGSLTDIDDLGIVVCASSAPKHARELRKLARKLELPRMTWRHELTRAELAPYLAHATLVAAPLSDCPRNARQGCAPLKILEAMAAGKPVVASELPPVAELDPAGPRVAPDRPAELARAIRLALAEPAVLAAQGEANRRRWSERYTWDAALARLRDTYDDVLATTREMAA